MSEKSWDFFFFFPFLRSCEFLYLLVLMLAELINNYLGDSTKDRVIRREEENKCKK